MAGRIPLGARRAALLLPPLLVGLALFAWFLGGQGVQSPPLGQTPTPTPTQATLAAPAAPPATPTAAPTAVPPPATSPAPPPTPAPTPTPTLAPPVIARFGLSHLPADDSPAFLPLDWDVRSATETHLERSSQEAGPTRRFREIESRQYTLVASNDGGSTSRSITVYVLRPPIIETFEVAAVQVGDVVRLTWRTDRANRVYLDEQPLEGSEGTIEVPADSDQAYVLRAENAAGSVSRPLQITRVPTPTETPTEVPTETPTPTATATATATATLRLTEMPASTPAVITTPSPTPTPTPTSAPGIATPTSAPATPMPTMPACPKLDNPSLTATLGGGSVTVDWSASGGCGPYTGDITADYTYASLTRDYAVSALSGTLTDTPAPTRCSGAITYTLSLRDRVGQTATAATSTSIGRSCPPPVSARFTPPTITVAVSPTPNAAGWNNSDTTATWSVTDPDSAIASSTGCDPSTLTTDTSGTSLSCSATNAAGQSASQTVTVKLDKTPPTITGSRSPAANVTGWNNTDVTVTFTCFDALSGIDTCGPSPQVVTTEGMDQSRIGTGVDRAGNSATVSVGTIDIDKTPPTSQATQAPAANAAGWNTTSPVTLTLTATDNPGGSGVQSITFSAAPACPACGGHTVPTTTTAGASANLFIESLGQTTVTFFATDRAGNVEAAKTTTIKIDPVAPTTKAALSPTPDPSTGAVSSLPVTLTLSATDNPGGSGVKSITYNAVAQRDCPRCPPLGQDIPSTTVNAASTTVPISVEGNTTITFSATDVAGNAETPHSIVVTVRRPVLSVTPTNGGTVSSTPAGITNCSFTGGTCSAAFNSGTAVTLTAIPSANFTFDGWSGDCTGTGTCTVTMDRNRNVSAAFFVPIN